MLIREGQVWLVGCLVGWLGKKMADLACLHGFDWLTNLDSKDVKIGLAKKGLQWMPL